MHIAEEFSKVNTDEIPTEIAGGDRMRLPHNLYILDTMNTSDQSLFPIDSAFKRRWEWEYRPIEDCRKGWVIRIDNTAYDWWDFLTAINKKVQEATHSEDKKLGYWFVRPQKSKNYISHKQFIGKVLFYLWNDVYKDFIDTNETIFQCLSEDGECTPLMFTDLFRNDNLVSQRLHDFMRFNGIDGQPYVEAPEDEEEKNNDTETGDEAGNAKYLKIFKSDFSKESMATANEKHKEYFKLLQAALKGNEYLDGGKLWTDIYSYRIPFFVSDDVAIRIVHDTHRKHNGVLVGLHVLPTSSTETYEMVKSSIPEIEKNLGSKTISINEQKSGLKITFAELSTDFDVPGAIDDSIKWAIKEAERLYEASAPVIGR